jgi:hypothetical protein
MPEVSLQTNPHISLGDMFAIAAVKSVEERMLAKVPFVGNATFRSGLIKLTGAMLLYGATKNNSGLMGKGGRVLSSALTVDGVEDVVAAASRYFMGGAENGASAASAPSPM